MMSTPSQALPPITTTRYLGDAQVNNSAAISGTSLAAQSTEILLQIFAYVPDDSSLDHPESLRMVTRDMSSLLLVNRRFHGIAQTAIERMARRYLVHDARSDKSYPGGLSDKTETVSLIWNTARSICISSDKPHVSSAITSTTDGPASTPGSRKSKQHLRALYLNCGVPDTAHHEALQFAPEVMQRFAADALILTSHHPATLTTAIRAGGGTRLAWSDVITKENYPTVIEILRPGEWGNNILLRQLVTDGGPTLVHLNRSCDESARSSIKKLMQLTRGQKDPQRLVLALDDSVPDLSTQDQASILRDLRAYARNMAGSTPGEAESMMSRVSVRRVRAEDGDLFGLALSLDDAAVDFGERVAAATTRLPR